MNNSTQIQQQAEEIFLKALKNKEKVFLRHLESLCSNTVKCYINIDFNISDLYFISSDISYYCIRLTASDLQSHIYYMTSKTYKDSYSLCTDKRISIDFLSKAKNLLNFI